MKKFRNMINEPSFARSSLFIVFNAFLLYVLFFAIKNFDHIAEAGSKGISAACAALSPLFIGLIVAYLLDPLVTKFDQKLLQRALVSKKSAGKKKIKRESLCRLLAILITFIIAIAAIALIIYGFAVMLLGQFVFTDIEAMIMNVYEQFMNYEAEFKVWVANKLPDGFISEKVMELVSLIVVWVSDNFSASATITAISGAVGSIINFVIGLIISIYLLKDKEVFISIWKKFLNLIMPGRYANTINNTLNEVDGVISLFIRGALLDAVFVAILSSIGLSILGLEFGVFIGVFAGICNIIPYFGPVLGMVPAFIIGWLTEDFMQGLLAIVILLLVQQIDSNIIYPKVVGSSTGLHPLAVLLSVSVFGYFGGIIGMLLAVPTAGVVAIFIKKWIARRERIIAEKAEVSAEAETSEQSH